MLEFIPVRYPKALTTKTGCHIVVAFPPNLFNMKEPFPAGAERTYKRLLGLRPAGVDERKVVMLLPCLEGTATVGNHWILYVVLPPDTIYYIDSLDGRERCKELENHTFWRRWECSRLRCRTQKDLKSCGLWVIHHVRCLAEDWADEISDWRKERSEIERRLLKIAPIKLFKKKKAWPRGT